MAKIVGFGDSFVFGSEVEDNHDGSKAWPGLVARAFGHDYETLANPGCGNDAIAQQIYHYFSSNDPKNTLAVINWTWIMRWDLCIAGPEIWITLGPTCVPEKLKHLMDQTQSHQLVNFYHEYCHHSYRWNKFRNLQTIFAAQQFIKIKNIRAIQTYMEYEMLDVIGHAPDFILELRNLVVPQLLDWNGKNFLDWSRDRGHVITDDLHPLRSAHEDAADFWKDRYAQALA